VRTLDECLERVAEAMAIHIAGRQADREPIPDELGGPPLLTVTLAA
jgi:predicted RNase H-like HicB family nuclease